MPSTKRTTARPAAPPRGQVVQLLYLIDMSFAGDGESEHGLLTNLGSVTEDEWLAVPPGGKRSIRQIVGHLGACKWVYASFAFGQGKLGWDAPAGDLGCAMEDLQSGPPLANEPPRERVLQWLEKGHRVWRGHVGTLTDAELLRPRAAPWGKAYETRWLIATLIQHDLYHAGEINHIRALLQGNDAWPW